MMELGELQREIGQFKQRNTKIYVISLEDQALAQESQKDFPGLRVVADSERHMAEAFQVIHPGSGPDGGDTTAPTTILVDGEGKIRWTFRPDRVLTRLSPEQLREAVDKHLLGKK